MVDSPHLTVGAGFLLRASGLMVSINYLCMWEVYRFNLNRVIRAGPMLSHMFDIYDLTSATQTMKTELTLRGGWASRVWLSTLVVGDVSGVSTIISAAVNCVTPYLWPISYCQHIRNKPAKAFLMKVMRDVFKISHLFCPTKAVFSWILKSTSFSGFNSEIRCRNEAYTQKPCEHFSHRLMSIKAGCVVKMCAPQTSAQSTHFLYFL